MFANDISKNHVVYQLLKTIKNRTCHLVTYQGISIVQCKNTEGCNLIIKFFFPGFKNFFQVFQS